MEACVRSRLTYGTQAMSPKEAELQRLETCWRQCLRSMVRNGWRRKPTPEDSDEKNYHLVYTNTQIEEIVQCMPIRDFIVMQHLKYIAHVCRQPNDAITKKLLFSSPSCAYYRDPWIKISNILGVSIEQAKRTTQSRENFAELLHRQFGWKSSTL